MGSRMVSVASAFIAVDIVIWVAGVIVTPFLTELVANGREIVQPPQEVPRVINALMWTSRPL